MLNAIKILQMRQPIPLGPTTLDFVTATPGATLITNWIVPAGVTSIDVLCIGGGGAGSSGSLGRGGGGGGASAQSVVSVTPGETLEITVGRGGQAPGSAGVNSRIRRGTTALVVAAAGSSTTGTGGGAGGTTGGSTGTTRFAGATGQAAGSTRDGGGAAGLTAGGSGAVGNSPGGNGGLGFNNGGPTQGINYGGGGGGGDGESGVPSANGADGLVRITY